MATVDELLARRRLERVPVDRAMATQRLSDAVRHLEAARLVLDVDLAGAYQLASEAARKAIAAHMAAHGLRVPGERGAHQAVGEYALSLSEGEEFSAFDRMRRNRNRSAYASRAFSRSEVLTNLDRAEVMVRVVTSLLG